MHQACGGQACTLTQHGFFCSLADDQCSREYYKPQGAVALDLRRTFFPPISSGPAGCHSAGSMRGEGGCRDRSHAQRGLIRKCKHHARKSHTRGVQARNHTETEWRHLDNRWDTTGCAHTSRQRVSSGATLCDSPTASISRHLREPGQSLGRVRHAGRRLPRRRSMRVVQDCTAPPSTPGPVWSWNGTLSLLLGEERAHIRRPQDAGISAMEALAPGKTSQVRAMRGARAGQGRLVAGVAAGRMLLTDCFWSGSRGAASGGTRHVRADQGDRREE